MKSDELKQALRSITKVLNDPRLGPGRGDQLLRAKRELETVARSGKVDRERIFRAVEVVAAILLQVVENDVSRRPE